MFARPVDSLLDEHVLHPTLPSLSWYAPLLHGCTTVVYEGKPVGTPDAGALWRVIEQHQVRGFFTAPTALRAVRKEDPDLQLLGDYDISCLRVRHTRSFLLGAAALR